MPPLMWLIWILFGLAAGAVIGGLFWPTRKTLKFLVILAMLITLVSAQPTLSGTWAGSLWFGFGILSILGVLTL